jgi:LysM repeat protein
MSRRTSARIMAPLALLLALLAVFYVIQHSDTSSDSGSSSATTKTTATKTSPKAKQKPTAGPKTYTVQSGDTLTAIADKTGVSADQITELNPNLDPQGLQVGQKVKLRP